MGEYLTAVGESVAEYSEKHSRFIATLRHCETEQEANSFIEEMRSKYWDARHNCFAYSVCKGARSRFSDDGEPHGTAGKPILDVITGSGVTDIAIVVTRYFGGILLGTGGLVRAYSKSSKEALQNAEIAEMVSATVYETKCHYTDHARLLKLIESYNGIIKDTEFTDNITLTYVLTDDVTEDFLLKLSETFSAKITAKEICKQILPFVKKNKGI
ncbi:MAG: YigZ family protein [Ruminococcaceae bacterium]|nr:YigZ family protein [Oscillospiraceae bacterium]